MKHCILLLCLTLSHETKGSLNTGTGLLMFLIDGFRWDYLDNYKPGELPGLERFVKDGVKAEYLQPEFVSNSYPSYYTLLTGLYTENHGMVHNYMWDPLHPDEKFSLGGNEDAYNKHWWNDAEPFWITATKQGLSVHMWYWRECAIPIQGTVPSFCLSYKDHGQPTKQDIDYAVEQSLSAFKNGTANIAGIYHEDIDAIGHTDGPDAIDKPLRELDSSINTMFEKIDQEGLSVNVMLFSDHGMSKVEEDGFTIDLLDYLNEDNIDNIICEDTSTQIWPAAGKEDILYEQLKRAHPHLHVYRRNEIPSHWHHTNHRRIPPLFLTVDVGYILTLGPSSFIPGHHGYDPFVYDDMKAVFFAHGPAFKKGVVIPGFSHVNLYQVMCHLTGVQPRPHNGTWVNVCSMFDNYDGCPSHVNDEL